MIYNSMDQVIEQMRASKLAMYRVYSDGQTIACNDDAKLDIEKAVNDLARYVADLNIDSSGGVIEIALSDKQTADVKNGGAIKPKFKYKIKLGGSAVAAIQGPRTDDSNLRNEIATLREELAAMRTEKLYTSKIEKLERELKELREEEPEESPLGEIIELAKPYLPALLAKITGTQAPTALADNVQDHAIDVENADEIIDDSIDVLTECLGHDAVAEFLFTIAESCKKNPEKIKSYLPLIKNFV